MNNVHAIISFGICWGFFVSLDADSIGIPNAYHRKIRGFCDWCCIFIFSMGEHYFESKVGTGERKSFVKQSHYGIWDFSFSSRQKVLSRNRDFHCTLPLKLPRNAVPEVTLLCRLQWCRQPLCHVYSRKHFALLNIQCKFCTGIVNESW